MCFIGQSCSQQSHVDIILSGDFFNQRVKLIQFGRLTHAHQLLFKLSNSLAANFFIARQIKRANRLTSRLLNRAQHAGFFLSDKHDRFTLTTSTSSSTNTVNVGLIIVGHIVVDDVTDTLNIQAAGSDIGGNHYIQLALL